MEMYDFVIMDVTIDLTTQHINEDQNDPRISRDVVQLGQAVA
jgi:hypothetical protein